MHTDNATLFDYHFSSGDKAQYTYIAEDGSEKSVIVNILDWRIYPDGKRYIISAHEHVLGSIGIVYDTFLSDHYYSDIPDEHKAAYLDPDELTPNIRHLSIIVDNTKVTYNESNETRR